MDHVNGDVTPTQTITPQPIPKVVHIPPIAPKRKSFHDRWGTNESDLIALYAFLLGVGFSASLGCALLLFPSTPQCYLYISFLCFFHFMEYYITAKYKSDTVTLDGKTPLGGMLM